MKVFNFSVSGIEGSGVNCRSTPQKICCNRRARVVFPLDEGPEMPTMMVLACFWDCESVILVTWFNPCDMGGSRKSSGLRLLEMEVVEGLIEYLIMLIGIVGAYCYKKSREEV